MKFVVSESFTPFMYMLLFVGSWQSAKGESFMDMWLSREQFGLQDDWFTKQVASQVQATLPSSTEFSQDDWLARQQAKVQEEWLAKEALQASQESSASTSFNQDMGITHQSEPSSGSGQESAISERTPAAPEEAEADLQKRLLWHVQLALGKEHSQMIESNGAVIEKKMTPMFQALPKNEYGRLGHPSARYMLHRFFVEQHGWFIDGLFSEGAALNTSSPSHALKGRVPMFIERLFEKRLSGRGFALHEMAVLVAIVEDSVHHEAQAELKKTYQALDVPLNSTFSQEQVELLVEVYMGGFVMQTNMSNVSSNYLYKQTAEMLMYYPTWLRAQEFFREVRKRQADGRNTLGFAEISAIVRELVDSFGTFHGRQCQGLKSSLKSLEGKGSSGCVSLPDFYKKGLKADTNWLFVESPEYLRQIGVLDESQPQNPRLLAANYINSPTNCLQPTGYYMVCCHNECDDILGGLEKQIGWPTATPHDIIAALRATSHFDGSSLRAGLLAPSLLRRLREVADYHGGRVPLHGRLFAQWLHHVYPHECPYPHKSGSKHPQWVLDFEEETGKASQLSDAEMESFIINASKVPAADANKTIADAGSCAPWQKEEELFAPLPSGVPLHELENDPHLWNITRGISFLLALITFSVTITRSFRSVCKVKYQPKILHI